MSRNSDPSFEAARRIIDAETADRSAENGLVYLEAFYSLALLAPPATAPLDLEERIAQACGPERTAASPASGVARRKAPRWIRVLGTSIPIPVFVFGFLCLALVGTLAVTYGVSSRRAFRPLGIVYLVGTPAAPAARGALMGDGDTVVLFVTGLAELAAGYDYVAWESVAGGYVRLGRLIDTGRGARLSIDRRAIPSTIEVSIEEARADTRGGPVVLITLPGDS
jgi:hypothetical protein